MKKFFLFLSPLGAALAMAQPFSIDAYKLSGGGGTSTGGVHSVTGTIGQPDAGKMSGGSYTLEGGFWSVAVAIQTPGAPTLSIARSGNNIVLSWPESARAFDLEESGNLALASSWTAVSQAPVTNAGQITVTLPALPGSRFFRLRFPSP
ncbi:MAG: hypothetical protein HY735_11910 [Verrucomicrobia bacterium]|nr:hypothetical protein [Verrucomicrobiota bacterium]